MATRVSKLSYAGRTKIASSAPRWYERDGVVLLLLAIITVLVFAPACTAEFVSWDDNLNVSKNAFLNPPTFARIGHFWRGPFLDLYVPITYSLWGLLAAVAWMPTPDATGIQLNPWVFHVANLIVHLLAVLFAYALLRRVVGKRWPAAAGALLFALHPLQVEPVAWVTGLKDVLCGMLSLAALWQYICFAQADMRLESSTRKWTQYAAAILFFSLAILAKPLAVVIPAAALVLDLWVVRRAWLKVLPAILPMAIVSAGWMVLSVKFQTVVAPADGGHVLLRPLIATDALAFYAYKLIFPLWLGFHYDRSPMTVIHAGWLYYTWLVPAGLCTVAFVFRKKSPWALPAILLFVIGVGPVLGLVPFSFQRYATVADRYVYLAMLGPAFALAAGMAAVGSKQVASPRILIAVVAAGLMILGVRTFAQTFTWHDNASLFANAVNVNPNSSAAYDGMAGDLASRKHPDETREAARMRLSRAKDLARRAADLAPESPDAYITLGSIDNMMGDLPGATEAFRKAVQAAPDKPEALDSLGGALAQQGQRAEAETLLLHAIHINPTLAQAHLNLGMLRAEQWRESHDPSRLNAALEETRIAIGLDGADAKGRVNFAMLLYFHGERQAALEQLAVAKQIDPDLPSIEAAYRGITQQRR